MTNAGRRMTLAAGLVGASSLVFPWRGIVSNAQAQNNRLRPNGYSVRDRLDQFGATVRTRLSPHFQQVKVAYPPHSIALIAFKDQWALQVYARNAGAPWRFIRHYPVRASSGNLGPKLEEGDHQVPEGIYRISLLNPNSLFHVSLRLDYPNTFDRRMAARDGRRELGGDIMIHGRSVSVGCLAMGDEAAEDLFTLVADTGLSNALCIISPVDFRRSECPAPPDNLPQWTPELYAAIKRELSRYPAVV